MQHQTALRRNQARAVLALLSERTMEDAAAAAGVHRATLWRWAQEPIFRTAVANARRDVFSSTVNRLVMASTVAVDTLQTICGDPAVQPSVRVSAASSVLEHTRRAMEVDDLAGRLDDLEERMAGGEA